MLKIGKNIQHVKELESTNQFVKNQLKIRRLESGLLVTTDFQLAGKGYHQNTWESEKGKNLLMTLYLEPDFLAAENQFLLSKITCLAIRKTLANFVDPIYIKWPNDIYVGLKKISGILIEHQILGMRLGYSIIGVGININQDSYKSNAPNPVSLKMLTGKDYPVEEIRDLFLKNINSYFEILKKREYYSIHSEYLKALYQIDEWKNYIWSGQKGRGKIIGVNQYGMLRLLDENENLLEFGFKEIEFISD